MANTLATPTNVMKEVGRGYANSIKFVPNLTRKYDDQYMLNGAKQGDTIYMRLPQRWQTTQGEAYQPQPILDQLVPITLGPQRGVHFGYSSRQASTELDEIRKRYVTPAANSLANAADVYAYQQIYRDIWNAVGVPGITPSATLTFLQAGVKLTDGSVPMDGRISVMDALAAATVANTASALFQPGDYIAGSTRRGRFDGKLLGIDEWFVDSNRAVQTTGTFTSSSPQVKGAGQTGSTIDIDGWASGATFLKKGDRFTIAGVNSVNPESYSDNGRLQVFVITADTNDVSTETATLPISPSIITSGPLQTVSNSPANDAVVTVFGATAAASGTLATTTSPQTIVFTEDLGAFVMVDLEQPNGGAKCTYVRSKEYGFSIRFAEQWSGLNDQNMNRLEFLPGAATLQPRFGCIIYG